MKKITAAIIVLFVLVVGGGVGWAAKTILMPPPEVAQVSQYSLVTAQTGTLSSSIRLDGGALWEQTPSGVNNAAGVVTEVRIAGSTKIKACDVLYLVNEHPVVIGQGAVPAFRAMTLSSKGRDVAQLQQMLHECKFLAAKGDGVYGPATARAVKAWQKSLGITQTGVVEMGSIIFVPSLPTQVLLDPAQVSAGAALTGGETVLSTLGPSPTFFSSLTERQVGDISPGMETALSVPAGSFTAVVEEVTFDEDANSYRVEFGTTSDRPVCADMCDQFPVQGVSKVGVEIIVIAPVQGTVVPLAAIATNANGSQVVVNQDSDRIPVQILQQSRGQAIVEGLELGTLVRVPGDQETPGESG